VQHGPTGQQDAAFFSAPQQGPVGQHAPPPPEPQHAAGSGAGEWATSGVAEPTSSVEAAMAAKEANFANIAMDLSLRNALRKH